MVSDRTLAIGLLLVPSIAIGWANEDAKKTNDPTPVPIVATPQSESSRPADQEPEPQSLDENAIRELEAIRRELGASPLQGSLLDQPNQRPNDREPLEFGSQLRELYGDPKDGAPIPQGPVDHQAAYWRLLISQCDLLAHELEMTGMDDEAADVRRVQSRIAKKAAMSKK